MLAQFLQAISSVKATISKKNPYYYRQTSCFFRHFFLKKDTQVIG